MQNLSADKPLEMRNRRHAPKKSETPVVNGSANASKSLGSANATSVISAATPPIATTSPSTPAKKEKKLFHIPKLQRSKSSADLEGDAKFTSLKNSIRNVFSTANNSSAPVSRSPPSSNPSSAPGSPHLAAVAPKNVPPPAEKSDPPTVSDQGPRRVSSVGTNMMFQRGSPTPKADPTPSVPQKEIQAPAVGVGNKAAQGRPTRSTSDPPAAIGITRAKTLKECGITNRGRHAGKGATATVTRCSSKSGRVIALKVFKKPDRSDSDAEFKRRIDLEFTIAHGLHHPNVIETMELIWDDGKHNWVETMEWCGGGDLFSIIKLGHMTPLERNCCFKQLIRGVAYMHSMGIAHRDIKPENLLLNDEGQLKITDFGVSDVVVQSDGGHKKCHGLCGSEPYMAPELHTHEGMIPLIQNISDGRI
jgi:tRNA A-37 threonylcarbamoyl transferase component Bud32